MDICEAIERRISCRAFADRQIEQEKLSLLQSRIDEVNRDAGLNLQLYSPRGEGQTAIDLQANVFAGTCYHYIACVAPNTDEGREKVGYYGEKLVLLATQMDLATCWIGTNYNERTFRMQAGRGEALACVILLGYPMLRTPTRQWLVRASFRQRDSEPEAHIKSDTRQVPDWFMDGVRCMQIGPSGVNLQPVTFCWKKGEVSAYMPKRMIPIQDVDLGIGKLHFELGSRKKGSWQWGQHGVFRIEE